MYNLYQLDNDLYEIHSSFSGQLFRRESTKGTLLAFLTYATYTLHFNPDELQFALLNMLETGNNAANFGVNRTFLFSFDKDSKRPKTKVG